MDRRRFLLTSLSGAGAGPLADGAQRPKEGLWVADAETLHAIARDLRHIQAVVRGYSQLMLEKMALTDPLRRCAEGILAAPDLGDEATAYLPGIVGPYASY